MFFLGRYHHSLDDKGRLTIPARFRDLLQAEGAYVMQGFDHNLIVVTSNYFEALSRRLNGMTLTDPTARQLRRLLYSSADHVELDRAGRLLLPTYLREAIGLQSEAVIVGAGDYFEIWSPGGWEPQAQQLQDEEANAQRFSTLDLSFS